MQFGRNNRKALALIALVFVLGVAIGAVGHSVADRRVLGARTQPQPAAFFATAAKSAASDRPPDH